MTRTWPALNYDQWSSTCDTLHAHTQVIGKLAVALAPPEPQLQHGALRLTTRGWETLPLPAPDGSGALGVTLDLRAHEVVLEHTGDARWEEALGEYVLDLDDIRASHDPHGLALEFARSAFRHSCTVCERDPALAASAEGQPSPLR
jgi:hypothetical protein